MRKTIYLKFILAYALFAFFGFVTVATFVSRLTYEYCQRQTSRNMYQEATRIADTYAADLYNSEISLEAVQKQMEALSYFMDAEIWIINPSGRMVVNSADAPDPEQEIIVEGFDPTVTQKNYYTRGTFFDSFDEEKLSVIAPIINNYKTRGYVIIHTAASKIDEDANNMLNISYLMLIVILFLSIIILIFFTEIVYRPLRKIIAATEQYAAGNMHYELNVEGDDEMGYLAASLGYMARTVASSEDDQKKFIANVSHDFRSPLTSIRGFLEAMQDGTIPPEMHQHYIGVVLNETERLTKLTNSLLTLNNLNTKGMLLQMTDWDINDVIRKVSASFEQVCRSPLRPCRHGQNSAGSLQSHRQRYQIQQLLLGDRDRDHGKERQSLRQCQGQRHRNSQRGSEPDLGALLQDRPVPRQRQKRDRPWPVHSPGDHQSSRRKYQSCQYRGCRQQVYLHTQEIGSQRRAGRGGYRVNLPAIHSSSEVCEAPRPSQGT